MNGCDYNHLIKGREHIVTHGIVILCVLFHILQRTSLNAPFKWFHCAKHTVTHLKHLNVSIMTQVRYKALLIR